jgi:Na+/proline symporter
MDWSSGIDLAEALLGLPSKYPGRYEDVTKLARVGTVVGLGCGFFAAAEGGGFWAFCATIFAGCFCGGMIALWFRRMGVHFARWTKPNRRTEIAGCAAGALLAILCLVASVLKPNILTIFGIFFFSWGTVRYFHRQQALARLSESSESSG